MPDQKNRLHKFFKNQNSFRYPGGYLKIENYRFGANHYFESIDGAPNSSFGCIINGRVELKSQGSVIKLNPGDIFFVPANEKYSSRWTGTPFIDFYGMHSFPALDGMSETGSFRLGKITLPGGFDPIARFREIYRLMETQDTASRLRAVGLYYDFTGYALSALIPRKDEPLPGLLIGVMRYIEQDFASDISVPELAVKFNVSESTLYHLFRRFLGTTPVNYRNDIRIERALPLIEGGKTIEETAAEVGFNSAIYFRSVFINKTSMTPSEYRKSRMNVNETLI